MQVLATAWWIICSRAAFPELRAYMSLYLVDAVNPQVCAEGGLVAAEPCCCCPWEPAHVLLEQRAPTACVLGPNLELCALQVLIREITAHRLVFLSFLSTVTYAENYELHGTDNPDEPPHLRQNSINNGGGGGGC